jgi:hypothetical protein
MPDESIFPNCTEPGCPGHTAGYLWAQDNNLTDEGECDGKSDAFIEGCQIYCQQQTIQDPSTTDSSGATLPTDATA